MEYYNSNTNTKIEIGGLVFSIPNCWYAIDNDQENTYRYWDCKDKVNIGQLSIATIDTQNYTTNEQEIIDNCPSYAESIMKGIYGYTPKNLPIENIEVNGYKGITTYSSGVLNSKKEILIDTYLSIIYNSDNKTLVTISLMENSTSEETYWNDYLKIVENIKKAD